MSLDERITVRLRAIVRRAERTTPVDTGRLSRAIPSAIARGLALSVVPGGRDLLAREAEVENARNLAEAMGLPRSRADELVAEVNAEAATLPRAVPWPEICRVASYRLGEVDMAPLRRTGMSTPQAFDWFERLGALLDPEPDQGAYDNRPDDCWRCDAQPATSGVGLCAACRGDLT